MKTTIASPATSALAVRIPCAAAGHATVAPGNTWDAPGMAGNTWD